MVTKLRLRFTGATVLISALIFLIVLTVSFLASAYVTYRKIVNQTQDVLQRGYYQDANLEEASYMLVYMKGSTYFVKRSAKYTETEQKGIVRSMTESSRDVFEYNGRVFYFGKADVEDGVLYAVDDITSEIAAYRSMVVVFLLTLVISVLIVVLLAWSLSHSIFAPLQKALDKQSALIANASHELKTPLAVICAQMELIKDETAENENAQKWIEGVNYQTERMQTLIKEMLELSKLESHNDLTISEVNVSDCMENLILTMEASCFEKQVSLNYEIAPDVIAQTDKNKLEKLTTILLDNAVKYTPSGGEIKLTVEKRKNAFYIGVRNTGEGISKENLPKIFDRFFRQDEARSESGNSFGLGLSIAKSLSEALKGSIKCESEQGAYALFSVTLPLVVTSLTEPTK